MDLIAIIIIETSFRHFKNGNSRIITWKSHVRALYLLRNITVDVFEEQKNLLLATFKCIVS